MDSSSEHAPSDTTAFEKTIGEYVTRFYQSSDIEPARIKHNIWTMKERHYDFNIIITSILCIFDATLFPTLPKEKGRFFEDLLTLNAHQTKSSKLCLVNNSIHLRIIRGLEDFDYSEFSDHVIEYQELYPVIYDGLKNKYNFD